MKLGARRLRVHAVLDGVFGVGDLRRELAPIKLRSKWQRVHEVARPPARDDGLPFQVFGVREDGGVILARRDHLRSCQGSHIHNNIDALPR